MNIQSYLSIKNLSIRKMLLMLVAFLILTTASLMLVAKPANAAPVVGFNAGNIIDDFVFTNASTMNPDQIQVFLNSKVSRCDTNGTQQSEYGGGTRRQWAESKGYSAPFTCLKDYYENGRSAAQIIYDSAQEFQINPQVLIVLLQKEQSLVTDTWPLSIQYRSATGYGCPDTAACDSQYYGLTNQIRWSARMFRAITNNTPTWYTPYVLGNNYIRWSPNSACGGSNVVIQNRSTQALYNYTPYQPNQSAINAGYGSGDACGAYGNRNFYLYFTDWFGSVRANDSLLPHPDGTLVNIDGSVYLIQANTLHHVINGSVFDSNNFRYSNVKPPTSGDRKLGVSWPLNFIQPGTLYSDETGVYTTIYENSEWVKQHVSYASFVSLNYSWDKVRAISKSEMPAKTSSVVLSTSKHPDGTLIKNSSGVYFIDHGTKRYVSAAVFESQGWSWNNIFNETTEDTSIPRGADMLLKQGSVLINNGNLYIVAHPASGPEIKRPIGPWSCFSNVMNYSTQEAVQIDNSSLPIQTGSNISC